MGDRDMTQRDKIKPEVGQILYRLNVGNAARHVEQKLTPVRVTKVGRKYFTCASEGSRFGTEYHLEDWTEKTEYSPDSALYSSQQAWEEEKESRELIKKIRDEFNYGNNKNFNLNKLRGIAKILFTEDQS
jgi:hypothetical protein